MGSNSMYVMPVESIFLEGKGLRMLKFGKNILQASRHINNLQNNTAVQLRRFKEESTNKLFYCQSHLNVKLSF